MKVKKGLLSHKAGEQYVIVASEEAGEAFNGMIRSNATGVEILKLLDNDCTEAEIVDALFDRFDAPREVIARDVAKTLGQLRATGLLDE